MVTLPKMICRLSADPLLPSSRFYALEYSQRVRPLPSKLIHEAGSGWAKVAEDAIFANYGKISVLHLMVRMLHPAYSRTCLGFCLLVAVLMLRMSRLPFYSTTTISGSRDMLKRSC